MHRNLQVPFREYLINEARALLIRLQQVRPFPLSTPMLLAAGISRPAQQGIHDMLKEGIGEMRTKIEGFTRLLSGGTPLEAAEAQKAYAILKVQFNWLLDRLDIFADALSQRGEHDTGIRLAGMDALAEDTLRLDGNFYRSPPVVTYLDRGHGAAIRRARTRLPGGKSNPVAVIRIPRERMVSTGIASSLVHEVGHQGATLLGLIPSLRRTLRHRMQNDPANAVYWNWYERWISEILSDFWSVAMIGVGSTTGLMNVVSVPSYFVFRLNADDPHPPPWIRVRLSIAFGAALYPDPQWVRLKQLWDQLYPLQQAGADKFGSYKRLEALIPAFVGLITHHRPASLEGKTLQNAFPLHSRQPDQLRRLFRKWPGEPGELLQLQPSLFFALVGQARADGALTPGEEQVMLDKILRACALRRSVS